MPGRRWAWGFPLRRCQILAAGYTCKAVSDSRAMTLTFLGAGSAFSRRYQTTCALLETPSKARWLVDCGRQAPEQLYSAGLSWHDISGQLVTHAHGDHVFGLEEFAFARYYAGQGGPLPTFVAHAAVRAEVWACLAPSLRYIERNQQPAADGALDEYFEVLASSAKASERDSDGFLRWEDFELPEFRVRARGVPHVPLKPSTGFEFSWQVAGQPCHVWWSGDSQVESEFLVEVAARCQVIFQDCSFAPKGAGVHGDFEKLLALPSAVREKIVLMHHDDDLDAHRARALAAGFRLAQPGDVYDLERGTQCGQLVRAA